MMEKRFELCSDNFLKKNLFTLNEQDKLYSYKVNNKVVGYGIIKNNKFDMIKLYIDEKYQNNHFGSELFKKLLETINEKIYVSTTIENIKMIKIILNNHGIEIGRNNGIITYEIKRY